MTIDWLGWNEVPDPERDQPQPCHQAGNLTVRAGAGAGVASRHGAGVFCHRICLH